jgi:HEAT repeats
MKFITSVSLSFLVCMGHLAWSEEHAESAGNNDALLAKCTKILNYGETYHIYQPSKTDAVSALGLLGDVRAVPDLVAHLENEENNALRLQIVKALGWIGSTNAVPALETALNDKYPLLRKQAASALKDITGKDYDYDKTGLLDIKKLRGLIRSSTNTPDKAAEEKP